MKPTIPPAVIRFIGDVTYSAISQRLDICESKAIYLTRRPWDDWRVAEAEKFCALCGFDFWNLSLPTSGDLRDAFGRADWTDTDDPTTRRALDALIEVGGGTPTETLRRSLASSLRKTFRVSRRETAPVAAP